MPVPLLFCRRRLRCATHHAESNIFLLGRAIGFRIGRTIRAAADNFALAVARQHPLGNVSAEVIDGLFVIFALSVEAANFFQQRCSSEQFLCFFTQMRGILGIRRISGPVIERIFAVAVFIQVFHFVLIRQPPRFLGLFGQPVYIGSRPAQCDRTDRKVGCVRVEFVALVKFGELRSRYFKSADP